MVLKYIHTAFDTPPSKGRGCHFLSLQVQAGPSASFLRSRMLCQWHWVTSKTRHRTNRPFPLILLLLEASCQFLRTFKEHSGKIYVVRNGGLQPRATWAHHPGSTASSQALKGSTASVPISTLSRLLRREWHGARTVHSNCSRWRLTPETVVR